MLFSAIFRFFLHFHSPYSFSHLPLPCEVQKRYHCIPNGPNYAKSQEVGWILIWVTQLSLNYLGHPVLSHFR